MHLPWSSWNSLTRLFDEFPCAHSTIFCLYFLLLDLLLLTATMMIRMMVTTITAINSTPERTTPTVRPTLAVTELRNGSLAGSVVTASDVTVEELPVVVTITGATEYAIDR